MGLDTVELVMDVEESFGIEIPDDDAQRIITVGDLYEFVKSQTDLAPAGTCLTAATFYEIRRGFTEAGITERFGPSTHLSEIAPWSDRRSFWFNLAQNTQLQLPALTRPSWIVLLNILITCTASALIALAISERDASGNTFMICCIACLCLIGSLTALATRPLAKLFSKECSTFRSLSERVLALNAAKLKGKHGAMGSNDIWVILRELIVNQLGVDADEVTPTASFIKDLGCN